MRATPAAWLQIALAGSLAELHAPDAAAEARGLHGPDAELVGECAARIGRTPEGAARVVREAAAETKALLERHKRALSLFAASLNKYGAVSAIHAGELIGDALAREAVEEGWRLGQLSAAKEWTRQRW